MRPHFRHALVGLSLGVLALSACSSPPTMPVPTRESSASASPAAPPTFAPHGSAFENKEFFRALVARDISQHGLSASTIALAERLAAAGFARAGIEFTDNATAVGMKPDSVTVSVKLGSDCLVAQYGPSIRGLAVSVLPVLPSGGCLLGRSINHL